MIFFPLMCTAAYIHFVLTDEILNISKWCQDDYFFFVADYDNKNASVLVHGKFLRLVQYMRILL